MEAMSGRKRRKIKSDVKIDRRSRAGRGAAASRCVGKNTCVTRVILFGVGPEGTITRTRFRPAREKQFLSPPAAGLSRGFFEMARIPRFSTFRKSLEQKCSPVTATLCRICFISPKIWITIISVVFCRWRIPAHRNTVFSASAAGQVQNGPDVGSTLRQRTSKPKTSSQWQLLAILFLSSMSSRVENTSKTSNKIG
ncbi:unnamed protein product, partial [Nesidiocoris tenuis]